MEFKNLPQFTKSIEDRTVIGLFAIHGNVDSGNDRSHPGAFAKATEGRKRARFVWQHSMSDPPIAKINYIRELSRDQLPEKVLDYAPDATGGAEVSRTYLQTPRGDEVLTGLKEGAIEEMSYSYDVLKHDLEEDEATGKQIRNLYEMRLWDISDVLWGMNEATVAAKGLVSRPFAEHSDSVVLLLEEYVERARGKADFRASEGRPFPNRDRLLELKALLDELVAATEPVADPATLQALFLQYQRINAELNGAIA